MALRIDILTLFPEMFGGVLGGSILKRAAEPITDKATGQVREPVVSYHLHQLRDYTDDAKHRKVDAAPYGGGPGMVIRCQPVWDAVRAIENQSPEVPAHRVLLSPQGRPMTQHVAEELSGKPRLLLICGHYEGLDERVLEALREQGGLDEVSIGDYVLSGGELGAMVVIDAVVRLLPGALGHEESADRDSFSPGAGRLLDHPHYTRPGRWQDRSVPPALMSGDHARIDDWRRQQAEQRTRQRRPDLLTGTTTGAQSSQPTAVVTLREAQPDEYAALAELILRCFPTGAEAELLKALASHEDTVTTVLAEQDGRPVGLATVVMLTHREQPSIRGLLALGPVAVDPLWQGRGIGSALVREAIRHARQAAAKRLFVLGNPGYYGRFGFTPAQDAGFTCEYDAPPGAFQALDLRPHAPVPGGLLRYPAPFGQA